MACAGLQARPHGQGHGAHAAGGICRPARRAGHSALRRGGSDPRRPQHLDACGERSAAAVPRAEGPPARPHRRPSHRRGRGRCPARLGRRSGRPADRRVRALRHVRARGRGAPRPAARRAHATGAAGAPPRRGHPDDRRPRGRGGCPGGHEHRDLRSAARAGAAATRRDGRGDRRRGGRGRGGRRRATRRRRASGAAVRGRLRRGDRHDAAPQPRRPVLRFRGGSALHRAGRGHAPGEQAVGARLPVRLGRRCGAVLGAVGARLRGREAGAARLPRLRRRAAGGAPRHAHLPLRAVRDLAPAEHGGALRRGRGRGRPAAPGGRVRRPVPAGAADGADRIPVVLDQEARAALHGRGSAHERCAEGRRLDRPVRAGARTRRLGTHGRGGRDPRRSRRLQPLRLRLDAPPAQLARGSRARGRCAAGAAGRAGDPRLRTGAALARAPGRGAARAGGGRRRPDVPGRCRCDRLLPARGEELLDLALPAPARTRDAVGVHARRAAGRPRPLCGRAGLGAGGGRPRDHAPRRPARRGRAGQHPERRRQSLRAVRGPRAVLRGVPRPRDPRAARGGDRRGARRRVPDPRALDRRADLGRAAARPHSGFAAPGELPAGSD